MYTRMHADLKLAYFVFFCLTIVKGSVQNGITYDQTCSSDCSQKFPVPFKCVVKGKQEWILFKQNIQEIYDDNESFDAPIMTSVDWYLKSYSGGLNPSLNISFAVPDDSIKGVLLEFSSPSDLRVQDVYYHYNRKFRLFEINTESTPIHKPISIFYDCMIGLDENDFRVYEVTLQSLPGTRTTYYVTTYYQGKSDVWKPAIATTTHSGYIIYVVFEKALPEMSVSQYKVDLMNYDENTLVQSHRLFHPDLKTSHTFLPVKPGKYYVQISVYSYICPNTICTAKSWNVTIPSAEGHGVLVLLENHDELTKVFVTMASIVGLIIIVVSLICYILRARQLQLVCCCMKGTTSGARTDLANNLRDSKSTNPLNGGKEKTALVEGSDQKFICLETESDLKPSDNLSVPKDKTDTTKNDENLKPSMKSANPETINDTHEENRPQIAEDIGIISQINFSENSFSSDEKGEGPSLPLLGNQTSIGGRTPWCSVHSRPSKIVLSNTCPVHGSAVHRKYGQLVPSNSSVQISIHANGELAYSSGRDRVSQEYERLEQELMRINSLRDVSEV